jgi:hypothetical protein
MRILTVLGSFAASLLLLGSLALPVSAATAPLQNFSSGSTGANGVFPPSSTPPSGTDTIILNLETGEVSYRSGNTVLGTASVGLPTPDGVFNFTTFTTPSGIQVRLIPDSQNHPAQFLTTGDVVINSSSAIYLVGNTGGVPNGFIGGLGGSGGPGGYNGGTGGNADVAFPTLGTPGAGPYGGAVGQIGISTTSNRQLQPVIGGSGGGGGNPTSSFGGGGGGGGGGALLLASSGNITIDGYIYANGGGAYSAYGAGAGSGGSVHIVANTVGGSGLLSVSDGQGNSLKGGYVRIEAFVNFFNGVSGANSLSITSDPSPPLPTGLSTINIQSVGGIAVPTNSSNGSPSKIDITFPTQQVAPVLVIVSTKNVPLNTPFTLSLATATAAQGGTGKVITATGTINSGTVDAGSGSTTITLPVGTSVIDVIAAFQLPNAQAMQIEKSIGEKVARAEVRSRLGGEAGMDYITTSGRRIHASSVNSLR